MPVTRIHWPPREVNATIKRVESASGTIEDPIARARALELAGNAIPELQARIRQLRANAIREAMETRTVTAVAEELGISRARLYQVLGGVDAFN